MLATTPGLSSMVVEDGAVILDISRDTMITLDRIGAFLWVRIEQDLTLSELASALVEETGANLQEVMRDIGAFIEKLREMNPC